MSVIGIQKVSFKRPKRTDYLRGIDCFNEGRPPEAEASRPFIDGWNKRRDEAIAYNLVHDTMTELEYLRGKQNAVKGKELPDDPTSSMLRGYLGMDKMEQRKVSVPKAKHPKIDRTLAIEGARLRHERALVDKQQAHYQRACSEGTTEHKRANLEKWYQGMRKFNQARRELRAKMQA